MANQKQSNKGIEKTKENTIKINWESKMMGCRTIDPSDGFNVQSKGLTLYMFETYKSSKHTTSADVNIIENAGNAVLINVESIDWISGSQYPYTTQGSYIIQQTREKYNRLHISVDRVPCSKTTIQQALDYLTPAEVKKAADAGRKVKRQGDFFFIEMKKKSNFNALHGTRHTVENGKVKHPEHKMLKLGKGAWKAIQRKTMNNIKAD